MDPFLGEIRPFGFNFNPRGWALCNGQLMAISQNTPLFSLLGTNYGGNGQTTFGLPNLQGRAPMHWDNNVISTPGELAGTETVQLVAAHLPSHTHALSVTTAAATTQNPSGAVLASPDPRLGPPIYEPGPASAALTSTALAPQGSNIPVSIMQPSVAVNFCIALAGVFPPRS
jgi:microcystin-dependent protein